MLLKKKRKKLGAKQYIVGFILGLGSIGLIMGFFLPILNDKSLYDSWFSGEAVSGLEPVGDDDAEIYVWNPGSGQVGSMPRWEINQTYVKEFLKDNFWWRLQASVDNVSWTSTPQFLSIGLGWSDELCGYKVNLTLDTTGAPRALYYRFILGVNKTLKDYAEVDGWEWTLTISDNITLFFNWSDIQNLVESGKIWFDRGVTEGKFWFGIQTVNKINPGLVFVVDPTYGLVGDATVASFEYDGTQAKQSDMVRVNDSQYYAIVSVDSQSDAVVDTIQVNDSDGSIKNDAVVDTLNFGADTVTNCSILHFTNDLYIVEYTEKSTYMMLKMIRIFDNNGTIADTVVDTWNPSFTCFSGFPLMFTQNILVVVCTGASYDLFLRTIWVNNSGTFNNSDFIGNVEIDTSDGNAPNMCLVDSDTVVVVYNAGQAGGNDGYMSTWNITSGGDISATYSQFWEFDTSKGGTPTIEKVTGNIFMVAYEDTSSDLYVKTCQINDSGMLGVSPIWVDTQAIDTTNGDYPTFFDISYNAVSTRWIKGISFSGEGNDGYVSTFDVDSTGAIGSEIDTLEVMAADLVPYYMPVVWVSGFYYLLVLEDDDADGWAKTFQIYGNNPPSHSNPSPVDSATDIAANPTLSVDVADTGDYFLNTTWYSNSSGPWIDFGNMNSTMGFGAINDDTPVNSWEYETTQGQYPDAIKLGSDGIFSYYAIVSAQDGGADGYISTIKIWENNGTIHPALVDSWEYDNSDGQYPSIAYVSGNTYAIAYCDVGATKNTVITVDISSTGSITKAIGDTLQLPDYASAQGLKLLKITNNVFVVVSRDFLPGDGFIYSFYINSSADISTLMDRVEFDTADASYVSVENIDTDTIAIAYWSTTNYINISTWNISASADITNTCADSWNLGAAGGRPCIKKISGNVFAIAGATTTTLKTFTIADTGMITKSWIDTVTITPSASYYFNLLSIGNNLYTVTYNDGTTNDGFINVVKIDNLGDIACFGYDFLEFDTADSNGYAPPLLVANDYYLIVWEGTGNDGWTCTIKIENSTNTTIQQQNTNFSAASTKYWWSVNTSDGVQWTNTTYSLTTEAGGEPPAETWTIKNNTINGSWTNNTQWINKNNTINGSWTNTTEWINKNDTINGSWLNITSWVNKNNTINGTWINITIWIQKNNTINGSWTNISILNWNLKNNTLNGSWINTTIWNQKNNTINGSWTNNTQWINKNNTINGSWINTTNWINKNDTINGSWTNSTVWILKDNAINGSWTNTSVTEWNQKNNTINGTWTNTTIWINKNNTINGSWFNITSWINKNNTINGTWINLTGWNQKDNTINGSWFNITGIWTIKNNTINGSWVNSTGIWNQKNNTINGTWSNISTWIIRITDPYPANNSNAPLEITLNITVAHKLGEQMNITWYYGDNIDDITAYLGSTLNIYNGTYNMHLIHANQSDMICYWSVNITDGSIWQNETFMFTTTITETPIQGDNMCRSVFSILAILGFVVFILIIKKRRARLK